MRQARRCEQIAFRVQIASNADTETSKKEKFAKLNDEALAKLRKHQKDEAWQKTLIDKFERATGRDENVMMIPVLKKVLQTIPEEANKNTGKRPSRKSET